MIVILIFLYGLSPEVDSLFKKSIDYSYREDFQKAESLLIEAKILSKGHPAPYFYLASLYELMWVDMGVDSFAAKMFSYSDTNIILGKSWVDKNPDDEWGCFFLGGGYTLRIFYYIMKEELFKSIPYIGPALKWLSRCRALNSEVNDIYLGIGGWEYFKGHFPFLNSHKEKGLSMIRRAGKSAKYVSLYANLAYAKIMIRENDFDEAILVLLPLVDSFPDSRTLTWPLLKAYYGKKDYRNALRTAEKIIDISHDNKFSYFESHYYKAKILLELRRVRDAGMIVERALEINVNASAPNVTYMLDELEKLSNHIKNTIGDL